MEKLTQKLKLLGAFNKKYKSRTAFLLKYLKNPEIKQINGDIFCYLKGESKLKHIIYFCDDIKNLETFITTSDFSSQLSLGEDEFNTLKNTIKFSEFKKLICYECDDFNGSDFALEETDVMKDDHYDLIRSLTPFHQTEFGERAVKEIIKSYGKGYISDKESFLYVEDYPDNKTRFGAIIFSKGSALGIIKLFNKSLYDAKKLGFTHYISYLEPANKDTIILHEKFGFSPSSTRPIFYDVIS
jgi:hypothetical protein